MIKAFIFLLLSFTLRAQDDLASLIKKQEKILRDYEAVTKREIGYLEGDRSRYLAKKNEFSLIQEAIQNRDGVRTRIQDELLKKTRGFSSSKKKSFYRCLESSLKTQGHLTLDLCLNEQKIKFSKKEEKLIQDWNLSLGKSFEETKIFYENQRKELIKMENDLAHSELNVRKAQDREKGVHSYLEILKKEKIELKELPKYSQYSDCNTETPEINLEKKIPYPGAKFSGPFVNVPRDHQDGLGTCYANTAKNLLVGLSDGKDVASFIDMALQYKKGLGDVSQKGLDAGESCSTLREVEKVGYCPQKYASMETGERNLVGEGLLQMNPTDNLAQNVNLVRDFLSGLETFKKGDGPLKDEILAKARVMIERIKGNSNLVLPLPVARFDIPNEWKIRETYFINQTKIGISEELFLAEYRSSYQKFYPLYVKALLKGKNLEEVFKIYEASMHDFIEKYGIQRALPGYKRMFLKDAEDDFKDQNFRVKLRASLDFLKDFLGMKDKSDEKVIEYCAHSENGELKFLGSLNPLLEELKKDKLNFDLLFDEKGHFKSSHDLMQLTVAPACLNSKSRKKYDFSFYCTSGHDTVFNIKNSEKTEAQKIRMLRDKVVMSLVQGYPLGNSFPVAGVTAHINTIVGLRFNKEMNKCQYLIRDSQNGRSDWTNEDIIFQKIDGLMEVRRK